MLLIRQVTEAGTYVIFCASCQIVSLTFVYFKPETDDWGVLQDSRSRYALSARDSGHMDITHKKSFEVGTAAGINVQNDAETHERY